MSGVRWRTWGGWLGGVAFVAGVAAWAAWTPYRAGGIYEALPEGVTMVSRHVGVAERWDDIAGNPLASGLARGGLGLDLEEMGAPGEAREWLEKLTGRELALAWRPGRGGRPGAWFGASWLGGEAQRLRWQLELFRVEGYTRLTDWPGHAAWRVDGLGLDPGLTLVIAFEDGLLLAALSEDPLALGEMLAARDGHRWRLAESDEGFRAFAQGDDREAADAVWVSGGGMAEFEIGERWLGGWARVRGGIGRGGASDRDPRGENGGADWAELAEFLGDAACAVAVADQEALEGWAAGCGDARAAHALRLLGRLGGERVAVAVLDGKYRGSVALGLMKKSGLGGLRVPTLVVAGEAGGGEEALARKLQSALDSCNARYRAAFTVRPAGLAGERRVWTLESAGGNEWVDALDLEERPACTLVGGWWVAASNLGGLRQLAEERAAQPPKAGGADGLDEGLAPGGARAWVDLARG
ncbi:MAG: hypothetical protein IK066_02330, partial [Kiritimatiellae bacterium]|nr:hypothetical protein [Kiritimatiellia bacterium]